MKSFLLDTDLPVAIPIEEVIYSKYGELANSPTRLMKKMDLARFLMEKDQEFQHGKNLLNELHVLISEKDELSLYD